MKMVIEADQDMLLKILDILLNAEEEGEIEYYQVRLLHDTCSD